MAAKRAKVDASPSEIPGKDIKDNIASVQIPEIDTTKEISAASSREHDVPIIVSKTSTDIRSVPQIEDDQRKCFPYPSESVNFVSQGLPDDFTGLYELHSLSCCSCVLQTNVDKHRGAVE